MRTSIDGFLPVAAQLKSIPDGETAQKPELLLDVTQRRFVA